MAQHQKQAQQVQVIVSQQHQIHAQQENIEQQAIVLHVHRAHIAQEDLIQQDMVALLIGQNQMLAHQVTAIVKQLVEMIMMMVHHAAKQMNHVS